MSLAAALIAPPAVFVADEPTLGLSPRVSEQVIQGLRRLREEGAAVLVAEEKIREVLDLADTVVLLDLGRVVWTGPCGDLDAQDVTRAYLGTAVGPGGGSA